MENKVYLNGTFKYKHTFAHTQRKYINIVQKAQGCEKKHAQRRMNDGKKVSSGDVFVYVMLRKSVEKMHGTRELWT